MNTYEIQQLIRQVKQELQKVENRKKILEGQLEVLQKYYKDVAKEEEKERNLENIKNFLNNQYISENDTLENIPENEDPYYSDNFAPRIYNSYWKE